MVQSLRMNQGINCPRCNKYVPFHERAAELTGHIVVINRDHITLLCPEPSKKHAFTKVKILKGVIANGR